MLEIRQRAYARLSVRNIPVELGARMRREAAEEDAVVAAEEDAAKVAFRAARLKLQRALKSATASLPEPPEWDKTERLRIGTYLLECLVQTCYADPRRRGETDDSADPTEGSLKTRPAAANNAYAPEQLALPCWPDGSPPTSLTPAFRWEKTAAATKRHEETAAATKRHQLIVTDAWAEVITHLPCMAGALGWPS